MLTQIRPVKSNEVKSGQVGQGRVNSDQVKTDLGLSSSNVILHNSICCPTLVVLSSSFASVVAGNTTDTKSFFIEVTLCANDIINCGIREGRSGYCQIFDNFDLSVGIFGLVIALGSFRFI